MRRPSITLTLCGYILVGGSLGCSSEEPVTTPGSAGSPSGGTAPAPIAGSPAGGNTSGGGASGGAAGAPVQAGGGGVPMAGSAGATAVAGTSNGAGGVAATDDFCAVRPGLAFCEDFEEHPVGAAKAAGPWAPAMNGDGSTIEIDGAVAHSGKTSLKVRAGGFNAFYVLNVATAVGTVPSALYLRAYVRITEPMAGGHNTYLVADTLAAPGAGNAFKLGEMNAMLMYNVGGDAHAALANDNFYTDQLPGAAFTANTWGCLELTLDHTKPEISVSLDGVAIPDMHHTDFPLDAYDSLRFGFEKYAGPMRDIWFDDLAVGTAPLGCR